MQTSILEDHNLRSATADLTLRATVSPRRLVLILVGILMSMLLSSLDQTIVGTAMPRVIADLNGLDHYAWVFTAYMLASTVMLPIYGKLSDIYGRRPFYVAGMALFLAGSALSGTSQDMNQLIVFRAIQGLGAGAMMPIVQAIIGDIFPPAERAKWQGLMMAVFGFAMIIGPTVGGFITDNWGWRWVFYVNMPLGLLALITAAVALPGQSERRRRQIDYVGAAALVTAAVPMLLAFSWAGTQYAWTSPQIVGLLAFAVVMFIVFFVIEGRAAEPIISPGLFRNRIFTVSAATTFLMSGGMFGAIMYLPLFVQGVMGASATSAGAVQTPMMLGFMASSLVGGFVLSRTGRYKVLALISFAIAAVGMFLLSRLGVNSDQVEVIRNLIITGLGLGVLMSLFTIVVQNAFPFRQLGQVTASLAFFRSIGGTISVAIFGSVMSNHFATALQASLPAGIKAMVPPASLAALENPQVLLSPQTTARLQESLSQAGPQGQVIFEQFMAAVRLSLAGAISEIFAVGAAAMVLALLLTLLLQEIPLRKSNSQSESRPPAAPLSELTSVMETVDAEP
jgi:EmrB/QacA subfamily drug resistance transporter